MLTPARDRSAVARFHVAWRAASLVALTAALGAIAAAVISVAAAQAADGDWSCDRPSGSTTWDLTEFRLPCSSAGISYQQSYRLRTPVDNLSACSVPPGFTWDRDVLEAGRCSRYAEAPTYHLRTPSDGLLACSVPDGFTHDQVTFDARCTADGPGQLYRLRNPAPVTITASQPSVEREPPMGAPVTISWRARYPVKVYLSVDGGAETPFAPAAPNGDKVAQIMTPHTYVFRVYGQTNHNRVFATTTVRGTVRTLSSVSPSAARRLDGKIDVFARATDGDAVMSTLASTGRVITPWTSLARKVLGAPSASWTADGKTLDVFAVGTDHRVIHRRFVVGSVWSAWTTLPGNPVGSGTVGVARFAGGLSLFARGTDSQAYRTTYSNAGATASWESMGMLTVGAPSAAWTKDGNRLEVFLVGNDYRVYRQQRYLDTWYSWRVLDDGFSAGSDTVTVASRLDLERTLFARGVDGSIWRRARTPDGNVIYRWQSMHRPTLGAPAASWTLDGVSLDLGSVDPDNKVARDQRFVGDWRGWANSQVASATAGLADNDVQRHVLVRGNDGLALSGELPRVSAALPFQSMGKTVADAAPAGCWTASRAIRVETTVGADRRINWRRTLGSGFTAWAPVPGNAPLSASATSVACYADRFTIAVRGVDNQAYVGSMTAGGSLVRPWQRLGGPILGSAAVSWTDNGRKLDVVVVAGNGHIYRRRFVRDFGWGVWREVPGGMIAPDGTVAVAGYRDPVNHTARISIFVRGADGIARMTTMTRSGRLTTSWTPLGKEVLGAPSASWSSDGRRLTVVAVGADYVAWYRAWANGAWSNWVELRTNSASAPFYALPTSQLPPAAVGLMRALGDGSTTAGTGEAEMVALLGSEDIVPKPPAAGIAGARSASGFAPSPSGMYPGAPSGRPQG